MYLVWRGKRGRMRSLRITSDTLNLEVLRRAVLEAEHGRAERKAVVADVVYRAAVHRGDAADQQAAIWETEWLRRDQPRLLRLKLDAAQNADDILAVEENESGEDYNPD